jgi:beta-aspartyl-peptidase (threonine type)
MAARRDAPKHGDPDHEQRARDGLRTALDAGIAILEAADRRSMRSKPASGMLEDDPCFNAGAGSVLTSEGCVELDAAIMDGRDRRAGAVAGLRTTRAPISLADG